MTRALLAVALLAGCAHAGPEARAREALAVLAMAGTRADDVLAHEYARRAPVALDRSATFSDYASAMAKLDAAVDALRAFRLAIFAAEAAVDAGAEGGLLGAMGCVAEAARGMAKAFDAAGVRLPSGMAKATKALANVPACEVSDAGR